MARFRAQRAVALLVAVLVFFVSKGESFQCYNVDFCNGPVTSATSLVECCLGDGKSFVAVPGGESCFLCIVFGWLNGTVPGSRVAHLSLSERAQPYELSVGYTKGAPSIVIPDRKLKFNVTIGSGSATIGTDFSLNTTRVVTNVEPVPVELSILDDEIALEPSESFTLQLMPDSRETELYVGMSDVLIIQRLEITILESEVGEVSVGFEQPLYQVLEGMQSITVCVVKDSDTAVAVQVEINDTPGLASNPGDYIFNGPQIFILNLTESQVCFLIPIVDDGEALEGDEDFTLELTQASPSGVAIGQMTARVVIQDNDNLTIGFGLPSLTVVESDGQFTMCVLKSGNTTSTVSVGIIVTDITAIGGLDYRPATIPETVTIGPTEERVCFTGIIINDVLGLEADEDFRLTLVNPIPGSVAIEQESTTITIQDDDVATVRFLQEVYTVSRNAGSAIVCLTKDLATATSVNVGIFTLDDSATSPSDYIGGVFSVILSSSAAAVTCHEITIVPGELIQEEESFLVILNTTSDRVTAGEPSSATVVIRDIIVGFGLPSLTVVESDGQFTMCVLKSANTASPVSVNITITDITAIGGLDYRPATIPETVTIGPTEERVCFTGIIINDVLGLEDDEDFRLTLVDPIPGSVAIGQETTTITIQDDDVVTVRFLQSTYTVMRSDGSVTVCVTKDLATATSVTVRIFTQEGTATDGLDYIGGSFTVTLSSSAAAVACQNITILDPGQQSSEEFFIARLDVALQRLTIVLGEPNFANITISRGAADDRFNCTTDIVMGDPLFTVPLRIDNLQSVAITPGDSLPICYEVHGNPDKYYNLISSKCVIVNARYTTATTQFGSLDPFRNIIDRIAIRAVYETTGLSGCQDIVVSLDDCSVSPNAATESGIDIRRISQSSVGITVPNCDDKELVMQIDCETQPRDMLRFQVTRGLGIGHTDTHGLLGQFWNNPAKLFKFEGESIDGFDISNLYSVEIANVGSNSGDRTFTGSLVDITWGRVPGLCLYVGNRQAGPIFGVLDSNDPVIEGDFELYETQGPFSDIASFGRFDLELCF